MILVYDAAGNMTETHQHTAASNNGKFFSLHAGAFRYKRFVMKKISHSWAAVTAVIVMMILQGCVGTAGTAATQCAKPTLTPSDAKSATTSVVVKIATKTPGAYLRYTLDGSIPTGGPSG